MKTSVENFQATMHDNLICYLSISTVCKHNNAKYTTSGRALQRDGGNILIPLRQSNDSYSVCMGSTELCYRSLTVNTFCRQLSTLQKCVFNN